MYRVGQRFGSAHIANILAGSTSKSIRERNHHTLSTFGIIIDYSAYDIRMLLYELIQLGYLHQSDDQYAIVQLTPQSKAVLQGKQKVVLTVIEKQPFPALSKKREDTTYDTVLFEKLRTLRKRLADEKNVPPYVIFADTALKDMTVKSPKNEQEFATVYGVGKEKLKKYSKVFLQEIATYNTDKN